jgi:hypothetical protein
MAAVALRGDSTEGENVGGKKESVALQKAVLRKELRRKNKDPEICKF